jgi:DNA-binding GntR family transcriptional regulator
MQIITPQPSLVDQVYEAILSEIMDGKFGPDARLVQEELAENFGVSRQPVQQALLLLRTQGILTQAPGRGLMVSALDTKRVRDLYEVRGVLDGLASAKAAERGSVAARAEGMQYIDLGRAAVESKSIARLVNADMDFHFFIYRLSGNPHIAETCAPHWSYFRCVMGAVLLDGETPTDIWNQHESILDAIIDGDAVRAEQLSRHHISHASSTLKLNLRAQSDPEASATKN